MTDVPIPTLPKHIVKKAKQRGYETIQFCWSGGSDEAYLHIEIEPSPPRNAYNHPDGMHGKPGSDMNKKWKKDREFEASLDDWAWDNFEYYGAGDGNGYGDYITYDLVNMKVISQEWYTQEVWKDKVTHEGRPFFGN